MQCKSDLAPHAAAFEAGSPFLQGGECHIGRTSVVTITADRALSGSETADRLTTFRRFALYAAFSGFTRKGVYASHKPAPKADKPNTAPTESR